MTYAFGIGKDLSSGWRVGAYARFFDGEGSSSTHSSAIPNRTPFRHGTLARPSKLAATLAGASVGTSTRSMST